MTGAELVQLFFAERPAEGAGDEAADLEARLAALVAGAGLAAERVPGFVRHLARLHDGAALGGLAAADLGLAYRALDGDAAATAAVVDELLPGAVPALATLGARREEIDEVLQRLRVRLLVGEAGGRARLADYAGRGSLRRWLRASAVNLFLNQRRDGGRELLAADERVLEALAGAGGDPELAFLKARYKDGLEAALVAALAGLTPEHKLALKYTFLDGLGLEELGAALRVSRATAHRRLQAAREALRAATEAELGARLGLVAEELASMRRLLDSQVDVSVRRLLAG